MDSAEVHGNKWLGKLWTMSWCTCTIEYTAHSNNTVPFIFTVIHWESFPKIVTSIVYYPHVHLRVVVVTCTAWLMLITDLVMKPTLQEQEVISRTHWLKCKMQRYLYWLDTFGCSKNPKSTFREGSGHLQHQTNTWGLPMFGDVDPNRGASLDLETPPFLFWSI